jgi:hypothetical protein
MSRNCKHDGFKLYTGYADQAGQATWVAYSLMHGLCAGLQHGCHETQLTLITSTEPTGSDADASATGVGPGIRWYTER